MTKKKINIGLFIDTFYPMIDGVINVVDNYARRLNKIANVTVFCPKTRKSFDDTTLPYKVVRCNMLNGAILNIDYDIPMPLISKDFQLDLKNANLDVIHIHSPFALGSTAVNYAKKHNIPVIATMHSQIKQDFMRTTNSKVVTNMLLKHCMKIYNACDVCYAVNDTISDIYLEYGANVKPKVLPNGTDFCYIKEDVSQEINKKFNLKPTEPLLLFVGRINKLKNIFFIADAVKILTAKDINFKMLFVGEGIDLEEFKAYITKLNLNEQVIFAGKITSRKLLAKIYKKATLFLFPSMYDANKSSTN